MEQINIKYIDIINHLSEVLSHKGRQKKGFSLYQEVLKDLVSLKRNFGVEVSSYFLKNLINNENITHKQKLTKINNLLRDFETNREFYVKKDKKGIYLKKLVFDYGLKKGFVWNTEKEKLINKCIKNVYTIAVYKEFPQNTLKSFNFIRIN